MQKWELLNLDLENGNLQMEVEYDRKYIKVVGEKQKIGGRK